MANVRIKDLTTTAATTASDDFFGVDGATNGTRKLNAYSPTFGGNLTVSGTTGTIGSNSGFTWDLGSGNNFIALSTGRPTITAAVASGNNAGAAVSLLARGGGSRRTWNLETDTTEAGDFVFRQSTTEAGSTFTNALYFSAARNATLSGNLTVSGTGNSSVAGTLLVATTTNSSNGKLQLATHTTSAGGIGFGTDTSLYRYDFTTLALKQNSGANKTLYFYADATNCGVFDTPAAGANYSGIYFNSTANSATIATKGTVALTLDSSQNATFAGTVTSSVARTAGAAFLFANTDNTTGTSSSRLWATTGGGTGGDPILTLTVNGATDWTLGVDNSDGDKFKINNAFGLGSGDKLTIDTTGNATFAGSIAIGNTVQTAAAVASTHKVTISIGGVTYYLLATNI